MSAATRGVILAIAAVILGVIILGQGFDDPSVTIETAEVPTTSAETDAGSEGAETDAGSEGAETDSGDGTEGAETDSGEGAETDSGDGTEGAETDSGDGTEGAETDAGDGIESPPVLHDPSEVRVLVVNGTTVSGAAGTVNNELIALGYNGLSPTNTDPVGAAEVTSVYYAEGFELDARQLAQTLNAPATSVEPLPADVPVDDLQEAHVVIILGPDLVSG